jgi:ribosomal-protein-alanine N-acetyltransferase
MRNSVDESLETVRLMEREDLTQVLAIERASYGFPWSEQIFRDCMQVYICMVLESADRLSGFAIVSCAAGESHMLNLCVAPQMRRQGRARALIEQSIASVMVKGAKTMFLEVRPSNLGALELYRQIGFVEIGRRKNYYAAQDGREDAIVMSRDWSARHTHSAE